MDNPAEERGLILDNVYERLTASRSAARAGGLVEPSRLTRVYALLSRTYHTSISPLPLTFIVPCASQM